MGSTYHVGALYVFFVFLDLPLQLFERNLFVLDDQIQLQLVDAVADGHALGGAPDEAVHADAAHALLELVHIRFVIYRGVRAPSSAFHP